MAGMRFSFPSLLPFPFFLFFFFCSLRPPFFIFPPPLLSFLFPSLSLFFPPYPTDVVRGYQDQVLNRRNLYVWMEDPRAAKSAIRVVCCGLLTTPEGKLAMRPSRDRHAVAELERLWQRSATWWSTRCAASYTAATQ